LADETISGSGDRPRPGAQALLLLASPLNVVILRSLSVAPKPQTELRRETGLPAPTTLRNQLSRLVRLGSIEKRRRDRFPGTLEYKLTDSGADLLVAAAVLERWLAEAPGGAQNLAESAAGAAIKALVEGWSTTMIHTLAAEARSLTQLDRVIGSLSYPSLQRRLAALRIAGLVEAEPSRKEGTRYAISDWGRAGIAPLAAAARWEGRHLRTAPPVTCRDIEASFLLAAPTLRAPAELSGACRMSAEAGENDMRRSVGVIVVVEAGVASSCTTRLRGTVDAWAHGSPTAWLDAVFGPESGQLRCGGNRELARQLIESVRLAPVVAAANDLASP
jgi:DNA-binding HxlR family transcriptional regulator